MAKEMVIGSLIALLGIAVVPRIVEEVPVEEQYNRLFDERNQTVVATLSECVHLSRNPGIGNGSFIMPSLGQWHMGEMRLQGAFDPARFRDGGHELVERLADYLEDALARRMPSVLPWSEPDAQLGAQRGGGAEASHV